MHEQLGYNGEQFALGSSEEKEKRVERPKPENRA